MTRVQTRRALEIDVHTWSQPGHSFPTDAQGRGVIPRDAIG